MTSGSSLLEPEPTRRPSGSAGIEYVVRTSRDLSREISNFQLDLNSLDPRKVGKRKSKHSVPDKPPQYLRISNCHDFAWSRQLWRDASFRIIGTAIQALLLYVAAAALLAHSDGLRGLDIVYFISACVTTVGLGDISPQSQFHRAASILTLPFGLVILSLCLAADETLKKTYMVPDKEEDEEDGFHGDIASRRKDKSRRHMERWYKKKERQGAKLAKVLLKVLLKYALILSVGCIFFMTNTRERMLMEDGIDEKMTFIDAAFFSTVVTTSVGYGHRIVPQSDGAKAFLTFYFFSAVVMGKLVSDLASIASKRNEFLVENEIVRETTWVHKTAMLSGVENLVLEEDYLIFKLLQLQKVDEDLLARLQCRFDELDTEGHDELIVGSDIPSAEQVAQMEETAIEADEEANEEYFQIQWDEMRKTEMAKKRISFSMGHPSTVSEGGEQGEPVKAFPEVMGALKIVNVKIDFVASCTTTELKLNMAHPGIVPLISALGPEVDTLELGPISIISGDKGSRPVSGIHPSAVSFAFCYNALVDVTKLGDGADLSTGPGMVIFLGAFIYFDHRKQVCDIKSFGQAPPPPQRKLADHFLDFGPRQVLPEITQEALGHRLHDVTLDFLKDAGAVAFAWINRAEPLPGMGPQPGGAFAYILENGDGVFFPIKIGENGFRPKVSEIHNFAWSRQLWYGVFKQTLALCLLSLGLYIIVGFYGICRVEKWSNSESFYFLSVSFATVGYGDLAPERQFTRGVALGLLPFGLIVVGFAIAASHAYTLSKDFSVVESNGDWKKKINRAIQNHGDEMDTNEDGKISREELKAVSKALKITADQAGELFDKLDEKKLGYIERAGPAGSFSAIVGRLLKLTFHVYWPVVLAATFFKVNALGELIFSSKLKGQSMTWVDALYFATVSVTTIGFGDITPQTDEGRNFMAVFVALTCIWVGIVLKEFIALYVYRYIGEDITEKIIDSTTWIHKCDLRKDGKINLPEFLLFKLQELQKVDKKILDILMARFVELDRHNDLTLDVGLDIPNAEQVAKLQSQMTWWNPKSRKISEAWEEMRLNIFADVARKQTYLNNKEKWLSKGTKSPLHGKQSSLEPEQSEALRASPSSSATSKKLRAPPRSPRSPRDKQMAPGKAADGFLREKTATSAGVDKGSETPGDSNEGDHGLDGETKEGVNNDKISVAASSATSSSSTSSSSTSSIELTGSVFAVSERSSSRSISTAELGLAQSSRTKPSSNPERRRSKSKANLSGVVII